MNITQGLGKWVNHHLTLCRFTWPFPFGVGLSWATTLGRNPDADKSLGNAFLLRGQGAVFSPGFGRLCTQLRQRGWKADDLRCIGDLWACRQLRAERDQEYRKPTIFVGHSCGGRYSIWAAWRLFQLRIPVDLIVCVDVAFPPPIPPNVKRAVHIYKSGLRIYPARPLRVVDSSSTRVENIDLCTNNSPVSPRGLHHLNITGSPDVQSLILRYIDSALEERN